MRRIMGLILALALLAGCQSSAITWWHWSYSTGTQTSPGGGEQVIYLATFPDPNYGDVTRLQQALDSGAYVWSISSDRLEIRTLGSAYCSDYWWEDCIQIYLGTTIASYNASAISQSGVTANNHIVPGGSTYIQFDFKVLWDPDRAWWNYVACHEIGHGAGGLAHGDDGIGPCGHNGWPTQQDLDNVATVYVPHGEVL